MTINIDQLASSPALQTLLKQLPPELLARPQVFQAVVLQTTLLPSGQPDNDQNPPLLILPRPASASPNPNAAQTPALPTQYRITLQWQNRLLQVLSPQPFPRGAQLQLETNQRGQIALVAAESRAPRMTPGAPAAQPNPLLRPGASEPVRPQPLMQTPARTTLQVLQQSARELLPRQQPLHALVSQLQKFAQPQTQAQLPPPVAKAVAQLLHTLPRPEQLQTGGGVRRAVENSGSFLENRLAPLPKSTTPQTDAPAQARAVVADIKAQIGALLTLVRRFVPEAPPASTPRSGEELVYSHKPAAPLNAPVRNAEASEAATADAQLSQLGKLLQASLARIQLHQLDSANARQVGPEGQPPVPTWIVEIPLRTPYGADQLQLRIEQRRQRHSARTRVQWSVDIALDLHAAGRLTAALTIVEKSVAATLWAEREDTHAAVRSELDYLRTGLESVGVAVTEMQCRLGMPPPRASGLTQRLVDIHT